MLFYLAGLTYAETAAALGTEPGAVRTRLHNARLRLRRSLTTLWQEEHMTSEAGGSLVEVRIAGVWQKRMQEESREWTVSVVLLEPPAGGQQLPIWIGFYEGMAMLLELVDDTFHAAVILAGANGVRSVDARPSDALNLALAAGTPIYVEPSVLVAAEQEAQRRFGRTSAEPPNFSEQGWDDSAAIVANHQQWMAAAQEGRRRRLGGGTAP